MPYTTEGLEGGVRYVNTTLPYTDFVELKVYAKLKVNEQT